LSEDNVCVICDGNKIYLGHPCTFCNGTGEWNQAGENYLKDHICQCIIWGREFCPVCGKKCHHDSHCSPKQRIVPGYGGMSNTISIGSTKQFTDTTSDTGTMQEQLIVQ